MTRAGLTRRRTGISYPPVASSTTTARPRGEVSEELGVPDVVTERVMSHPDVHVESNLPTSIPTKA